MGSRYRIQLGGVIKSIILLNVGFKKSKERLVLLRSSFSLAYKERPKDEKITNEPKSAFMSMLNEQYLLTNMLY